MMTISRWVLWVVLAVMVAGCEGSVAGDRKAGRTVLMFAPHPDDETFCCAATIQQLLAEGRHVHVVVFTNGDGWPQATSTYTKKDVDALTADDYLDQARVRQHEALKALAALGLARADVTFLGYPDAGLDQVYGTTDGAPFKLVYTQKASTYGPVVTDFHTRLHGQPGLYRRQDALADVIALLREWKPARVYVTHDADTHLDHQAAYWFVRDAVKATRYRGQIYTYVNHYDSYPCPSKLPCPAPVRWQPTDAQAAIKDKAMRQYDSQVWHFFPSDAAVQMRSRAPELFWPVDPVSFAAVKPKK